MPDYRFDDAALKMLAGAGWSYLNLNRSLLSASPETIHSAPGTVFMLGGTQLSRSEAPAFDGENVRWVPPGVTEALLDDQGRLIPLDPELLLFALAGHHFMPTLEGWTVSSTGPFRLMANGERFSSAQQGRWLEYHREDDLDGWYRAFLQS